MTSTTPVYVEIDKGLKTDAENILRQLGISPSSAIQAFYRQIVLTKSLPLELRPPTAKPTAIGSLSRAEVDKELAKGVASLQYGTTYTPAEVDAQLAKKYGL